MRHPHRVEKQNRGFSLVEVLVTLAVISILSIPIIQSFVNSAKTNKKAKNIQNATDIAQSVSEHFAAMSLDKLEKEYASSKSTFGTNSILFKNIGDGIHKDSNGISYFEGGDKEKFYVSVVLDPNNYSGGTEGLSSVNDYIKPNIHNLNENSSITCRGKLDQYDKKIVKAFRDQKGVEIPENKEYEIKKTSTFIINANESTRYAGKIEYKYLLNIDYTYQGNTISYNGIELGIGTAEKSEGKIPNLYIIYTPYFAMKGTNPVSNDEFKILYRTDSDRKADWEKPINVYLVQQTANYGQASDTSSTLNNINLKKSNIYIQCYYGSSAIWGTGSFDNKNSDILNFYTNIPGWDANSGLTDMYNQDEINKYAMNKLYSVSVYVWKDNPNGISFNDDGQMILQGEYFSSVTNVKED